MLYQPFDMDNWTAKYSFNSNRLHFFVSIILLVPSSYICRVIKRIDNDAESIRDTCFDVLFFHYYFAQFFSLNTAILHPINSLGVLAQWAHIVWILSAWMPKWKSVLWYVCSFCITPTPLSLLLLLLLLHHKTNVFHVAVKNGQRPLADGWVGN